MWLSTAAALGDEVSVTHTSELPNSPRPLWPVSTRPSSTAGSLRRGGGIRAARSAETAVRSSDSSIRRSAWVSVRATGGASATGTASIGARYIGRRSVIRDRPHGPTSLRVIQ